MNKIPLTIKELKSNTEFNYDVFTKEALISTIVSVRDYFSDLEKENKKYKEVIDKSIKCIDYNNRYRNGADIYQFVDIKSEILEPLKDILEQNEENSNIYLKEFNDWLKEVE